MGEIWQWNKSLELGIEEVDKQHMELLARVNRLSESAVNGSKNEAVSLTLQFLENYIAEHFNSEEKLQLEYGYPEYEIHKALHDEFKIEFRQLRDQFNREGCSPDLSMTLSRVTYEWLVEHIGMSDKKIADYINEKK